MINVEKQQLGIRHSIPIVDLRKQRLYLLRPNDWPEWPFLTMKRSKEVGVVFFCEEVGMYLFAKGSIADLRGQDFKRVIPVQLLREGWHL